MLRSYYAMKSFEEVAPPFFEWTLNIVARGLYMRRFDHYRAFRMLIAREIYSMQRDEAPFKNLNDGW